MKLHISFTCYFSLLCLTLGLASCMNNADFDYQAGVQPGSQAEVYFDANNTTQVVMSPEDYASDPSFTLTLHRTSAADQAQDIPLEVVSCSSELIKIPASVHFDAGATEADITISFDGIEPLKYYDYKLRVQGDWANPYSQTGSDVESGSIIVSEWKKIVSEARTYFASNLPDSLTIAQGNTAYSTSDIYKLQGLNRFKIAKMFGNEKVNLEFSIVNSENYNDTDTTTWRGDIDPKTNLYVGSWNYWYFVTDDNFYLRIDYGNLTNQMVILYPDVTYHNVWFSKKKKIGYMVFTTYLYNPSWTLTNTYIAWNEDFLVRE